MQQFWNKTQINGIKEYQNITKIKKNIYFYNKEKNIVR